MSSRLSRIWQTRNWPSSNTQAGRNSRSMSLSRYKSLRAKNRISAVSTACWSGLAPGDRLIVSELSRLGRSLGQAIHIVDELVKRKIRFTAIKESIHFEGKQDLQTKVMVALFGLFAEVERDLIAERTREGLASARAKGRLLGRPKGVLGKSRLDGKEEEIRLLLQKQVSKASIAKILGVTRPTIHRFIKTRRLRPHP